MLWFIRAGRSSCEYKTGGRLDPNPGLRQLLCAPKLRSPGISDERGRGMFIVDSLASSWGVVQTADGKNVWFELGRGRRVPGRAIAVGWCRCCLRLQSVGNLELRLQALSCEVWRHCAYRLGKLANVVGAIRH